MNCDKVFGNVKKLHEFTFKQIIKIDNYDDNFALTDDYYDFTNYVGNGKYKNGSFKGKIESCCHLCDECDSIRKDIKPSEYEKYKNYQLENVSHGSHTIDFLNAAGYNHSNIEELFKHEKWHDTPILFLMENPSVDYEIYEKVNNKYPTKTWYWIHKKLDTPHNMANHLDEYLVQGLYGKMVYALILKNKLSNAYLTNIIKCGMNNKNDHNQKKEGYLGTWWYQSKCKKNCIENILSKEIECLTNGYNELKVFAFGGNTHWLAKDYFQNSNDKILRGLNIQLVQLPHPSSRMSNNYRKYILNGIISDVLNSNESFSLNNNCLPKESILKEKLFKSFEEAGIDATGKRISSKKLSTKFKTQTTLFNNSDSLIAEVEIVADSNNKFTDTPIRLGYGYNFITGEYWGWDYDNREFISTESIKTFDIFKETIERIIL